MSNNKNNPQIIDLLFTNKVSKDLNFNQAVSIIAMSYYDLPVEVRDSIIYLVQSAQIKEKVKISMDNPFKIASLFHGNKDVRYYLNFIYSTGGHLIASNGHTLIKIEHAIEPGFYNNTGLLQHDVSYSKYPAFDKLLEKVNHEDIYPIDDLKTGGILGKDKYLSIEQKSTGTVYNFDSKYISVLKRIGVKTFKLIQPLHGLYFEGVGFEGIVMCFRV